MSLSTDLNEGLSRRMWLLMLEHGGRWTATELAGKCGVPVKKAESMAAFMARSKTARKVCSGKRKNGVAYMVTTGCMVPRDMGLGNVLAAAGIRMWDAEESLKGWAAANDSRRRAA